MVQLNETYKTNQEVWPYEKVYKELKTILVDALSIEENQITPEASLVDDLGAESIDFVDIAFRVEQIFGINLPLNELAKYRRPGDGPQNSGSESERKFEVQALAEYIKSALERQLTSEARS